MTGRTAIRGNQTTTARSANQLEKKLEEIYYNPNHPASLGAAPVLAAAAKVPLQKTQKWLQKQATYTLHKQARKHYATRKYYVNAVDDQWQLDLAEMQDIQRENQGYRYILTCIDILSRYGWALPLKNKSGKEVAAAIEKIFKTSNRLPKRIQTDQGKEFYNNDVKRLLEKHNIELFSVKSPFKCALVERWNRTIKTKIWKYFTSRNTRKWLDILPKIVHAYNHSKHRIIGTTPASVNAQNGMIIWERLYGKDPPRHHARIDKIKKGDLVRISKVKGQFEKGYLPNWSREEFIVDKINNKFSPAMVSLKDHRGEVIEGNFYIDEIQKIRRQRDDDVYEVEKVIRQKRENGEVWYFVKWLGYDDSFNSWVRKRDVTQVFNN